MSSLSLKIAGRYFRRNRLYTFIHIVCLAVGLTSMLLAILYVRDETSFDNFHTNNPNLFRVTTRLERAGQATETGGTGQAQGPAFHALIPDVAQYTRVMGGDIYGDVRSGNNVLGLRVLFVDSTFLQVFSFPLLHGQGNNALRDVHSVVISEKTARKFFRRTDVVGRLLHLDGDPSARRLGKPLMVTGVVKNPPANSSIQFDVLLPFSFMELSFRDNSWLNAYLGTFIVLKPRSDEADVLRRMNRIAQTASREERSQNNERVTVTYGLQRMTEIHLDPRDAADSNREAGIVNGSKSSYSIIFLSVAAFILLMACINFINISVAGSLKRAKEIGVRKITGSTRFQLMMQFMTESSILCIAALVVAVALAVVFIPLLNQISGKHIPITQLFDPGLLGWISLLLIINIVLAGMYPAYLITGMNPAQVLYRKNTNVILHLPGRILVGFQIGMALVLATVTLIFNAQMNFIQNYDLGYDPSGTVRVGIPSSDDFPQKQAQLMAELKASGYVERVSMTGRFGRREASVNNRTITANFLAIDADYLSTLKIQLKSGRNLSENGDPISVLVNEAFVKAVGLENPIGTHIQSESRFGDKGFSITGVVKDFHFSSLREAIEPMVFPSSQQYGGDAVLVRFTKNAPAAIGAVSAVFKKVLPYTSFNYTFLEDHNALAYEKDKHLQQLIGYASVVSLLICCLGLFGLSHLSVMQRRKETGIRTVLGATPGQLIRLFVGDFLLILSIASVAALPLCLYIASDWLEGFAYRIQFPWYLLPVTAGAAALLILITVSSLVTRLAVQDPATALRND